MKNSLKIILLSTLLPTTFATAQGGLLLQGGVKMVCSNAPYLVIDAGKWKNTASTFTAANSIVKFTGTASTLQSTIEGNNTFYRVELDKSTNDLLLVGATTTVSNRFTFSNGKLNLGGKTMQLNATAQLNGENELARSYGAVATGKVTITGTLNNPAALNVANLDMIFTVAGNLGNSTVDRRHAVQTLPSGNSILKHWRVSAATPGGWNATLRFKYFNAELNGLLESDLTIWRSIDNGVTWTDMGFATRNTVLNFVEQTGIADVSGWWTLGAPLPFIGPSDERTTLPATSPEPEKTWQIFPNPTTDWVTVNCSSPVEKAVQITLYNADGQTVLQSKRQLSMGENSFQLNLTDLPTGLYVARLIGHNATPVQIIKTTTGQ